MFPIEQDIINATKMTLNNTTAKQKHLINLGMSPYVKLNPNQGLKQNYRKHRTCRPPPHTLQRIRPTSAFG